MTTARATAKEQESFRARMIDEVLGTDNNGKVPMEKVVLIIWQYRDDPQVVKFMTRFVAKVCSCLFDLVVRFTCWCTVVIWLLFVSTHAY
jgi:hypothetical protein